MKVIYFKIIPILSLLCNFLGSLSAQTYINAQLNGNYWQHTELVGYAAGLGLEHKFSNFSISLNYSYGYGSNHRFKKFNNLNYDYWSTVQVDEDKWSSSPGFSDPINEMKAKTDYGKQHQLSIFLSRKVFQFGENKLNVGLGAFSSLVEHFFTFSNILVYNLDITPFYNGPLNYIPVSHQKFLTYGFNTMVSYEIPKGNNTWSPFVNLGLGPNYGSFVTVGVQLATQLKSKNKS